MYFTFISGNQGLERLGILGSGSGLGSNNLIFKVLVPVSVF